MVMEVEGLGGKRGGHLPLHIGVIAEETSLRTLSRGVGWVLTGSELVLLYRCCHFPTLVFPQTAQGDRRRFKICLLGEGVLVCLWFLLSW
jgi:hypothetical protein